MKSEVFKLKISSIKNKLSHTWKKQKKLSIEHQQQCKGKDKKYR